MPPTKMNVLKHMTPYVFNNGYIGDSYKARVSLHETTSWDGNRVVGHLHSGDVFVQVGDLVQVEDPIISTLQKCVIKVMIVNEPVIGWLFLDETS